MEQNISLVRKFAREQLVTAGMCADVCVHDNGKGNPHAHIMLTMRPIEKGGKWGQKSRSVKGKKVPTVDWNEREKTEDWRKAWAAYCNTALRINGHTAVVDHRSYERQGLDLIPTVHLGVAAHQMERRGIRTERGNRNREIDGLNKRLRQINARIRELEKMVKAEYDAPPTLLEIFTEMTNHPEQRTHYQQIADLKLTAQTLIFIKT